MLFKRAKDKTEKRAAIQNPKILDVNLIKGEVQISFAWRQNLSKLILALVILGLIVTEVYLGLDYWAQYEEEQTQVLTIELNRVREEVRALQVEADQALAYKEKSVGLSGLLAEHIYWSAFFDWLEKNTLSTVKFTGFSGGTDGVYELRATASSFQDASWQVKVLLDDPLVKQAEISQVANSESEVEEEGEVFVQKEVNFSLNLEINPEIFKK